MTTSYTWHVTDACRSFTGRRGDPQFLNLKHVILKISLYITSLDLEAYCITEIGRKRCLYFLDSSRSPAWPRLVPVTVQGGVDALSRGDATFTGLHRGVPLASPYFFFFFFFLSVIVVHRLLCLIYKSHSAVGVSVQGRNVSCVAHGSVVVLGVPVHLARRGHGCVCSGASFPGRLFGAQPWKTERVSLWNKEQAGLLSSRVKIMLPPGAKVRQVYPSSQKTQ